MNFISRPFKKARKNKEYKEIYMKKLYKFTLMREFPAVSRNKALTIELPRKLAGLESGLGSKGVRTEIFGY